MLKKFLCGAAIATLLSASAVAPAQAEELYVRNRLFKDAYFLGNTTYVPVEPFLRAVEVPWTVNGGTLILGQGESPEWSPSGDRLTARLGEEELSLQGIVRGGRLYVPAKDLAEFIGYGVTYNSETGIVDVVKGRMPTAADRKAAEELAAARAAEEAERDAAWQARVEKARADRKAKEEAAAGGEDGDGEVAADASDTGEDVKDTPRSTVDGEDSTELESYENESTATGDAKEEGPPPEADLVVLTTDANPNSYTGEAVFRAVLQNQGNAPATDVRANLVVVGPDGKEWVNRRVYYNGNLAPDGRWEIVENYRHRLGAAAPRGNFNITVTPTFKSVTPQE